LRDLDFRAEKSREKLRGERITLSRRKGEAGGRKKEAL